jgi:hypothetical protein
VCCRDCATGDRKQHERPCAARRSHLPARKNLRCRRGNTLGEDRVCAPQLEAAIAVVLGLLPDQVNILVIPVSQEEVDLHFGVYERMLAEKLGVVPPIQ